MIMKFHKTFIDKYNWDGIKRATTVWGLPQESYQNHSAAFETTLT